MERDLQTLSIATSCTIKRKLGEVGVRRCLFCLHCPLDWRPPIQSPLLQKSIHHCSSFRVCSHLGSSSLNPPRERSFGSQKPKITAAAGSAESCSLSLWLLMICALFCCLCASYPPLSLTPRHPPCPPGALPRWRHRNMSSVKLKGCIRVHLSTVL